MAWRLIDDGEVDIFRSLSVEEALARVNVDRKTKINTLRFWVSGPAVVLGRFQCCHKEVNLRFCWENGIAIARRFTGGGTVYHDKGNLNFALCMDQSRPYVPKTLPELYWTFVGGIASVLQELGIAAIFDSTRSCLRVRGKKITGTAGWIKRGVSFIHGTLLVDANLEQLSMALDVPAGQPIFLREPNLHRCMESKRDVVTTIEREMETPPTMDEIKSAVVRAVSRISHEPIEHGPLADLEREAAEALYRDRYSRAEWNLGYPLQDTISTPRESL